jgi:hypothetical protein
VPCWSKSSYAHTHIDAPSLHHGTGVFLSTSERSVTAPNVLGGQHGPPSVPHLGGSGRQRGAPRRVSPGDAQNASGPQPSAAPEQPSFAAAPPQGRQSLPQSAAARRRQVPISFASEVAEKFAARALNWV